MHKLHKIRPRASRPKLALGLLALALILSASSWGVHSYYQNKQAQATNGPSISSISSISPNQGPEAGGQTVVITGEGFTKTTYLYGLAAGDYHTCGLGSDKQAYCWGYG